MRIKERSAGVIVYAITAHGQREYLLLQYRQGYWDLPKGKLEPGESDQEAALRELVEETGLLVVLDEGFSYEIGYLFKNRAGDLVDKTVIYYTAKAATTAVIISDEHIGFAWHPYEHALATLTYHNAQELLSAAEAFLKEDHK